MAPVVCGKFAPRAWKEAILGATLHFNAEGVDFLFMLKSEEAEGSPHVLAVLAYTMLLQQQLNTRAGASLYNADMDFFLSFSFIIILPYFSRTMICKVKGAGEGVKTIGTRAAKMKRRLLKMLWHQTRVVLASVLLLLLFYSYMHLSHTSSSSSRVTTFLEDPSHLEFPPGELDVNLYS